MTTTFADIIPIERLISGVEIIIPGFGPVEVYGVRFDGEGYAVDYPRSAAGGWDDMDMHYVAAGGSVEHAGIGEPRWMRPESDVTFEEWQAKAEAQMEALDRTLIATVADALSVPALIAAE